MASEDEAQEEGAAAVAAVSVTTTPHADVAGIVPSLLPLETRCPPFNLRHYAGFWLPEVTLMEGFRAVHSGVFSPRPTDVLLASFPKSGTTWLKALAFATLKRSDHHPLAVDHPLRHRNPHDCVKFLEFEIGTGEEFEALPSPRLLATHLPYTLLPESGCRVVYICRDPKDALVSYWHFTKKASPAVGVDARSFTIQDAFELFCQGRCLGGPQWQHALQYWEESLKRPDRVLFLRYEEMLLDPESHLKKLAEFMGCGFSGEEEESGVVSAIVELCSLGKMKDVEVNRNGSANRLGVKYEYFLRKGAVGDWSNHLTPEMAERLDKIVEDALQGSGLTFGIGAHESSEIPTSSS
ncbi:hypothetical protein HU200_065505 [Digitaria exilis]|uniref:Sulfotransferase n=1 Tax=Digitaria exilis TaxID=1010633 RepID=A0A835A3R3_9POAL|nr:hypothetical protein HU200_065505 [Digitaria exilis]